MKFISFLYMSIIVTSTCFAQENVSKKILEQITLVNRIECFNAKFDQPRFSCGFLLKHGNDTFAVTAKHLLKIIKPEGMTAVSFENNIKNWLMYVVDNPSGMVVCDQLLNDNKSELLADKSTYVNDWLVFSIKQNSTGVKPLQVRTTPLLPGEKLYVAGWTRTMDSGPQRVYEFEYYKTIGNRILVEDIIVPEKFGGLSGAPLVDENGLVVGIVSNGTVDPDTSKKYLSPCAISNLSSFLENLQQAK